MAYPLRKRIVQALLLVILGAGIVDGIHRDEVTTVIGNAKLLCFSCIGLK